MSAKTAKKRSSPGADSEKNGDPFQDVELGDEDANKLNEIQKDIQRAELILERRAQSTLTPVYQKRRELIKRINKFWPVALMNNGLFAIHAQHDMDKLALSYLEDVWVSRDPKEPKAFTIEFYFKENPFFSDSVLKKEYRFVPPPAAADEKADADGITPSMLDFSWERDIAPQAIKINWKDEAHNLTKLYPSHKEDDDDLPSDFGSFFNLFETAADPSDLGVLIANEIFPDVIEFFLGNADGEDLDSEDEDEDEEEDDENEDEIDLEKPRAKKPKNE